MEHPRREAQRANRRLKHFREKQVKREEVLDTKNLAGFTDYTPYNAITGNDLMSAGRVSDPKQKLPGGFNTAKG